MSRSICTKRGCTKPQHRFGLCSKHDYIKNKEWHRARQKKMYPKYRKKILIREKKRYDEKRDEILKRQKDNSTIVAGVGKRDRKIRGKQIQGQHVNMIMHTIKKIRYI